MRIVVIHSVNGATKTVEFTSPRPAVQLVAEGITVTLRDEDLHETGFGVFGNAGLVALRGAAADQYFAVRAEENRDAT